MHPVPDRATVSRTPAGATGIQPPTPGPDARMAVKATPDGTLVVSGEIDSATAPRLQRTLLAALRAHPEGVTLDLADVTFCDCAGLRAFLTVRAAWAARTEPPDRRPHGRRRPLEPLILSPVSPRMVRLLRLTGTEDLFSAPRTGRPQ